VSQETKSNWKLWISGLCIGEVLKKFTARDVICRCDSLGTYRRTTSVNAAHFLDALPCQSYWADGGSEFEAIFKEECQKRNIRLFILLPNSPKLSGCVERAHLPHTEEFYKATASSFNITELKGNLLNWEKAYNATRPH
jgi:hypothetical protein